MKLTSPQLALLGDLITRGSEIISESYPPAKKLKQLGYAEWEGGSGLQLPELQVTEAGRRAYEEQSGK